MIAETRQRSTSHSSIRECIHESIHEREIIRVVRNSEQLTQANAVIVCAGMEGALPSVVGGLVGVPVIAVPTSVGYGASFDEAAALLGMLNSCSPNVTVVNIDNGFGAAYTAVLIARAPPSAAARVYRHIKLNLSN